MKNKYLLVGGMLSILVAALHIAIIIGGASWYRFFGAGEEMAIMAEEGSLFPGAVTSGIVVVFIIWGIYALSGAKYIKKKLPFLRTVLVVISVIYLLRGLALFPAYLIMPEQVDGFAVWSSLISLAFGLIYALGTKQVWKDL
jgi:hypothetical protein